MTIGSATSTAYAYVSTRQQNPFQQNLEALSQAVQSGNLSGAQQAYAVLTQSAQAQGPNGASNGQSNPFQQGLAAIGNALQSGSISDAQSALQNLQQTMKAHHGHRPSSVDESRNPSGQTSSSQHSTSIRAITIGSGPQLNPSSQTPAKLSTSIRAIRIGSGSQLNFNV